MAKIKLNKYEQALALLPGCNNLDRLVLYHNLSKLGYRWNSGNSKWLLAKAFEGSCS